MDSSPKMIHMLEKAEEIQQLRAKISVQVVRDPIEVIDADANTVIVITTKGDLYVGKTERDETGVTGTLILTTWIPRQSDYLDIFDISFDQALAYFHNIGEFGDPFGDADDPGDGEYWKQFKTYEKLLLAIGMFKMTAKKWDNEEWV